MPIGRGEGELWLATPASDAAPTGSRNAEILAAEARILMAERRVSPALGEKSWCMAMSGLTLSG